MTDLGSGGLFAALFVAGMASSLHCVGMCGPLLVAFSKLLQGSGERNPGGWWLYHGGRIWTYALLGFLAGWLGFEARALSALAGWHRPLALAFGASVLLAGLAALGWLPGWRFAATAQGCLAQVSGRNPWLGRLAHDPRAPARFLLGAVMGLLPCAMVYAALLLAAALPTPLHSAAGMAAFGLGTLPSLTAVILGTRLAPPWLRAHGPRLTAVLWISISLIILWRALALDPTGTGHMGH